MSWTYEWAANLGNLRSLEGFLKLASHAGFILPKGATMNAMSADEPRGGRKAASPGERVPPGAWALIRFWREAGPSLWFAKDDAFDREFRERFLDLHEAAVRGDLRPWLSSPEGALALVLLLDQFPRNSFRGSPRMYASDAMARAAADAAIAAGHDRKVEESLQIFFYLPLGHSESLADQERCVSMSERLGEPNLSHARGHRDIIERFGRFPHRNAILGRDTTPDERKYLDEGGYAG
jgi:uncharacterized protein (DUF924 family)